MPGVKKSVPSGLTRRNFLKTTGAVAGVAAVGGTSIALNALVADEALATEEDQIFNCMCGANCQGNCALKVTTRNGKVVNCTNAEMPDPQYNRICVRGFTHAQRIYDYNRMKYPMKRVGERGEGKWERISWEEAIDTISKKFLENTEKYGPRSNSMLCSCGNPFAIYGGSFMGSGFANITDMTALDVCLDFGDLHGLGQVLGSGWSFDQRSDAADHANARTVIVWSANPPNSQPHNWHFILDAQDRGAKIVVIDPNYTIAASKADTHIPINPGTDPALALAMCKTIIDEGWQDDDFLNRYTCAPFLTREDNKHFLRDTDFTHGSEVLKPYPYGGSLLLQGATNKIKSEESASHYMVWDSLSSAVKTVYEIEKPAMEGSYEVNGVKVTTAFTLLKKHLEPYTREWAEEVTGVPADTVYELAKLYACNTPSTIYCGYHLYDNCADLGHLWGILASLTGNIGKKGAALGHLGKSKPYLNQSSLLFPKGLKSFQNDVPWLQLKDILSTGKYKGNDYPIKSLYLCAANPINSYAAQQKIIDDVFSKIEFIVCADMEYSDSARYSDMILPVCHWFEYEWALAASHNPNIGISEKATEPLCEAKEDQDIFRLLADAMGVGKFYAKTNNEMLRSVLNTEKGAAKGISYESLKKEKVIADKATGWISYENRVFPTLSRRMEFYVENPAPRLNVGIEIDRESMHLPAYNKPSEAYEDNPLKEEYPLYYYTERVRWHLHSQWNYVPWLRELDPEPIVHMNPEDAASRGIKDGEVVEAFNERGHVVAKAVLDPAMFKGMVSSPKGWNRDQYIAGGAQELTNDYFNTMHMNTSFSDTLCQVRKYKEAN